MTTSLRRQRDFSERQRAFLDAILPLIKVKMDIYNVTIPKILIYSDGTMTTDYQFSTEQDRALAQVDDLIELIKQEFMRRDSCI